MASWHDFVFVVYCFLFFVIGIFACLVLIIVACFSFLVLAFAWRSLRAGCLFSHDVVVVA